MCKAINHHYKARIRNYRETYIDRELGVQYINEIEGIREQRIPSCNKNIVFSLLDNTMLKVKPDLWYEWDFEKNDKLGINIYEVTFGSEKNVWWVCNDCGSSYSSLIGKRVKGGKCPYCRGLRINHTNSLASLNPTLASEFDTTLNSTTPYEVASCSGKNYWWKCYKGHNWQVRLNTRNQGNGCPYCSNQKVLKGFNDMWTTNPDLASLLADSKDGYKYTESSGKKVDWKCKCGENIGMKSIDTVKKYGLGCHACSDGYSYPEKFMFYLLKHLNIDFKLQKTFEWSDAKRYDFYIPSLDMIIETHGSQHYNNGGFKHLGGRSLEDERENDAYKYDLAIENGIHHEKYIIIDCRKSDFEYIKNNIQNSRLSKIFDLSIVDWTDVELSSQNNFYSKIIEMWNTGKYQTANDIANEIGLSTTTVASYLNRGVKSNICDYNSSFAYEIIAEKKRKAVIQLDMNGNFIKEFSHVGEVLESQINGVKGRTSIVNCCLGNKKHYANYKWVYKIDYDKNEYIK